MGDHLPLHSVSTPDPVSVAPMRHRDGRAASLNERLEAAQLGVCSDGAEYTFDGYRYRELDDAVAYARTARLRPGAGDVDRGMRVQRPRPAGPTVREREVMATHGIRFDGRVYRYAEFSYERLTDALNQVRRMDDPD